ncbi:hypothetical protein [Synechococcus sp. TAK9802]|uniref:hypothetical protein n=1 Tax=Synechococcus sp. TAK9802 TaxID=1442558 RepID=UPI001645CF0E|nr:hypothetical protein [Synechococcus sp. TAK9802]QNI62132.1 hypothetical protein SynTAK9802_01848 [Synechococcus sp. TAK9802]
MKYIFCKPNFLKPKNKRFGNANEHGLALAIVLMVSAIAATTITAVLIRSYNSYVNGTRQSLADRAKEAAESGLNILIESLNEDHPEWLIESYDGDGNWSISRAATGGCRKNAGSNPIVQGISNTYSDGTEGIYRLTSYTFNGNNFYGGIGSFEMEGEIRSSNNRLLASAKIYQDMSIIAKGCDALPGDNNNQDTIWPGIFVQSQIKNYRNSVAIMNNTDPREAAEIICANADCQSGIWDSDYPEEPTIGDIEMPTTQEPPEQVRGISAKDFEDVVNNVTTNGNSCENFMIPEDLPDNAKWQDSDGTWHVYISGNGSASIRGTSRCRDPKNSVVISDSDPVRLYLDGSLKFGADIWIDTTGVNHAADFMILGTPTSTTRSRQNTLQIRGESPNGEALKAFIWLPNGRVRFEITRHKDHLVEGAIWSKSFWIDGNSRLGEFELRLPENMPQMIYQRLGKEFGIGQRDYVAQGVTSWYSYGRRSD